MILHSSRFESNSTGHGGNRRTAQIKELISQAGLESDDVKEVPTNRSDRYFAGLYSLSKYKLKFYPSHRVLSSCGRQYKTYRESLRQHNGIKLILWEDTNNYTLPYIAKQAGFNVLALPQNLESMVSGQRDSFTYQFLPGSFENEVKHLAKADSVFCISREEQWLLRLRGLEADYLPYYPPQPILLNLLELRRQREQSVPHRFLILGTAHNPPTRIGMIEQIQWLKKIGQSFRFVVDIAGYGTETLKEYCDDARFVLHGSVDIDKLNHLLSDAKAILVHQTAGVGALTRIPEMLIAGIPVIANANACRSAFSYSGVYCYDNSQELAGLMSATLDIPTVLERPTGAERHFIDYLKRLGEDSENRSSGL